ncbi:MAG: helix-turn-helix transcriptional regulator [Candidatus Gastranaerophilales bacterium]|nr:helix-turn-helix transcriptional regulator [Candidatus Gastranaerophilales bacterium]
MKRLRMEKKNVSLNEFALMNNISRGHLSNIEKGKRNIQLTTLWRIVGALGMSFSEFAA